MQIAAWPEPYVLPTLDRIPAAGSERLGAMSAAKVREYREMARMAEAALNKEKDEDTKRGWQALADQWRRMADSLEASSKEPDP